MNYCTDWLIIISNNHLISLSMIDSIYLPIYLISFAIYAELTSHMGLCKIHKECWNFVFLACPLCLAWVNSGDRSSVKIFPVHVLSIRHHLGLNFKVGTKPKILIRMLGLMIVG